MDNSLKTQISNYLNLSSKIRELENEQSKALKAMLSYELPNGKYKGMALKDVMLTDQRYGEWWVNSNVPREENDCLYEAVRLPYTLHSIAKSIQASEYRKREEEYEARRAEWCKQHGENYQLDYEIRHNINLRDWGM